jgi:hypothetical protein
LASQAVTVGFAQRLDLGGGLLVARVLRSLALASRAAVNSRGLSA